MIKNKYTGYLYHYWQTTIHKLWVALYLFRFCKVLMKRALVHDLSKYKKVEAEGFAQTIFDLQHVEYGSPEYKGLLNRIRPSIDHHQLNNTHHPEFWGGTLDAMPYLDVIELVADWSAAIRRGKKGNFVSSVYKNADRFDYNFLTEAKLIEAASEINTIK